MPGEKLQEPEPVRMSQLVRHENGHDVIDTYDIYAGPFSVRSVYVSSVYGHNLDLKFQELTNSKHVPPRAMPIEQPIYH